MVDSNDDESQAAHTADVSQLLKDVSSLASSNHILAIVALVNVFYDKYDVRSLTSEYSELKEKVEVTEEKLLQTTGRDAVPDATPEQWNVHLSEKMESNQLAALAKTKEEYAAASKGLNEFQQRHPHIVSLVNVQEADVNFHGQKARP